MTHDRSVADELCNWLITDARLLAADPPTYLRTLGERLHASGLGVTRLTTGIPTLHPNVDSFSGLWELGKGTTGRMYRMTPDMAHQFENSPLKVVYDEARTVRCPLETPPVEGEYGVLADLRSKGLTDYVVMPLPFSDGTTKAVSYATDKSGGFSDTDLETLDAIRPYLAAIEEAMHTRLVTTTLLDTYVGPVAGRRVADGAIRRGMQETIRAAIWFSDLKGFTDLSERLRGSELIALLNDYFDVVTAAIEAEGGEVLKFIGDAVMAIFQPDGGDNRTAAGRALEAALATQSELSARNEARRAQGASEIEFGVALHFGDVLYGNVGGENRLDFTVIGPAVNLASRIEGLTRDLNRPILVSADFAATHRGTFESLGKFNLKGIAQAREVLAP